MKEAQRPIYAARTSNLATPADTVIGELVFSSRNNKDRLLAPLRRAADRLRGIKEKPRAAVVGAGVIGLTNAILAQREGYDVTIYADLPPSQTTSIVAGATFAPYSVDLTDQVVQMTEDGWGHFSDLAKDTAHTGVRPIEYWEIESRTVDPAEKPYLRVMQNVQVYEGPDVPGGYQQGIKYSTFAMDMPIYLDHLVRQFQANGGKFVRKRFTDIEQLSKLRADVIFNCTGLGARDLVGDPALKPIKGQLAIIPDHPELPDAVKHDGFYAFRQPQTNRTILGGTVVENFDPSIEPGTRQTIVNANKRLLPHLSEADVTESLVGLRPYREGDVRVEAEEIDGKLIIHNYGHGGAGVTLSWGSGRLAIKQT